MKINEKTKTEELPCKYMKTKEGTTDIKCKITKLICILFWNTRGSPIGDHIFENDLRKCPGFKGRRNKIF